MNRMVRLDEPGFQFRVMALFPFWHFLDYLPEETGDTKNDDERAAGDLQITGMKLIQVKIH